MPILTNARHERFAQALAAGKTADEAYQEAGYTENRHNASRLKTNETIGARVAELLDRATAGIVIDKQWVLEGLVKNAQAGEPSASNRAYELIGKELGMFVDRSLNQNINTEFVVGAEAVSREEWLRTHGNTEPPETMQ